MLIVSIGTFCEGNYDDPEEGFPSRCSSAREQEMAGATVLRGVMVSVNIASYIRQDSAFVGDVPMVVDIVDSREKVEVFFRSWTE